MKKILGSVLFPLLAFCCWIASFNLGLYRKDSALETQKWIHRIQTGIQDEITRTGIVPKNDEELEKILDALDPSLTHDPWGQTFAVTISNQLISVSLVKKFANGIECEIATTFSANSSKPHDTNIEPK